MSRQRRHFIAEFKSELVIELLKSEKDLNTLAVEYNIQPNLLRNWKKEFLDNQQLCLRISARNTSNISFSRNVRKSLLMPERSVS